MCFCSLVRGCTKTLTNLYARNEIFNQSSFVGTVDFREFEFHENKLEQVGIIESLVQGFVYSNNRVSYVLDLSYYHCSKYYFLLWNHFIRSIQQENIKTLYTFVSLKILSIIVVVLIYQRLWLVFVRMDKDVVNSSRFVISGSFFEQYVSSSSDTVSTSLHFFSVIRITYIERKFCKIF